MTDEDLTPFRDDPALRALLAPAQPGELAGEEAALAMFRASRPAQARRRRALRRATVGGAGVILGLTLTGGVAAAYTTGLPDPVQDVVHAAIAPLPVPAPPTAQHRARQRLLRHLLAPHPGPLTSPGLVLGVPAPHKSRPPSAAPTATPHRSAAPSPTPSPTASAPAPKLSIAVSQRVVPVHGSVVLSGRLTRGSDNLPGRLVYAAELPAGESTWRRVASGRTADDGSVSLTVPALTSNVRLRLVTGQGVTSQALGVAVVPKLTLRSTRSGNDRVVSVSADGGRPGDEVVLLRRDGTTWTRISVTRLAGDSTCEFVVPGPGATRVRYRVRLAPTAWHAASFAEFVVPARTA